MRAAVMYGAGDVRIENVPDPSIIEPTDAIIRVVRACICGSDLWPYNDMEPSETGQSMGHEAIGVVEETGADVHSVKRGDVVVMPFAISDGTCEFCREGLNTACVHVGFFGNSGVNGAQAEALRIPLAKEFGATEVVSERGDEAVEKVKQLSGGHGVHSVLECVGTEQSIRTAVEITRPGGAVGRVGVPHYEAIPQAQPTFYKNAIV